MANFFSFDSNYQYEPVIRQIDPDLVEKDLAALRRKIIEGIKMVVDQKDLSRSELVLSGRICRATAGKILRNDPDKISTDRLLRVARRLGLKPKIKFTMESPPASSTQ